MNIQEALDLVDQMRPNMMQKQTKLFFLQELDQLIYEEILLQHEHTDAEEVMPQYDMNTDPTTELLVPDRYGREMYLYWLMSKIDIQNMEIEKYNNDRAMFDNAYDTMSDWWTRTRMPVSECRRFRI